MITTAIISEYNPFHNGHEFHINEARNITGADTIISMMSGNYVQRGEPAILDKYIRANTALLCGADICLQIPTPFCLSSAQYYAYGSINILNTLGICDYICFGSECGDIDILYDIAKILSTEPELYKNLLKENIKSGMSYATSVSEALCHYSHENIYKDIIREPNNTLGIEYIKALIKSKSNIKPVTIKRKGTGHNDTNVNTKEKMASATLIRTHINTLNDFKTYIPEVSYDKLMQAIKGNQLIYIDDFSQFFRFIINRVDRNNYKNYFGVDDAISSKIYAAKNSCMSIDNFILNIKAKNLSYSRISRALFCIITGLSNDIMNHATHHDFPYVRLLGLKSSSSSVLSSLRKNDNIQFISKWASFSPKNNFDKKLYEYDINSDNIYYETLFNKNNTPYKNEILRQSIIL